MQFETGNQKGGHYFCANVDINYIQTDGISYCYQLPITTLSCKQKQVIDGKYGKENSIQSKVKPFMSLEKNELMQELSSRSIKYLQNATKCNLEIILKKALKGTVRVPILIKNYPVHGLKTLNLEQYEMKLVEPMHDIGGHITNLFHELPKHLKKNGKQLLLETTRIYKQQK